MHRGKRRPVGLAPIAETETARFQNHGCPRRRMGDERSTAASPFGSGWFGGRTCDHDVAIGCRLLVILRSHKKYLLGSGVFDGGGDLPAFVRQFPKIRAVHSIPRL